jgi:methionyl-tRNA synthetase
MKKKRLITSALPYVNNAPHLGNIIGAVLSADVFARYSRIANYETLYICGSDGYGTATETIAKVENTTPEEICKKFHSVHEQVYKDFNISFDAYEKTFQPMHTEVVQNIFNDVSNEGYLLEKESEQTWCTTCDKFLADRLVTGECPNCNYPDARGDQCDSCAKLLNPTELLEPKCTVCSTSPELKLTKHLYIDLPKLTPALTEWQNASMEKGKWTNNAKSTTKSWMDTGLNPRPITRDLKWGVNVPKEGFEGKVFYVWFDAPLGYVSITKNAFPDSWESWWLNPDNVELYQFMGKDNIPFHSVIFPATQIATGKNWTKVHQLNVTEYLNYEEEKFSKSRNVGVFGTHVVETGLNIDLFRFYLLAIRPESHDSQFVWTEFQDRCNNELIDNICNLVNRILVYNNKNFPGEYKAAEYQDEHKAFIEDLKTLQTQYTDYMEVGELKNGLKAAMAAGKAANKFFQDQAPWKKIKIDRDHVETTQILLAHVVKDLGIMLSPFIPATAEKILTMVGLPGANMDSLGDFAALTGKTTGEIEILLQKIEDDQVNSLKEKYSGDTSLSVENFDIRVGVVTKCGAHPTSDKLYVAEVDAGLDAPISVVCGLADYYQASELENRKVLVLVNLETSEIRGTNSEGMILVGATRKKMELFNCNDFAVGDKLTRGSNEPKIGEDKITFNDFGDLKLKVEEFSAVYKGEKLTVNGQNITTTEIKQGKVK